ncbi:MAG: HPr family phosphocarrier protein [Fibrobacterota bacterium]
MLKKQFKVTADDGIHARPAAMIVELSQTHSSSVTISTKDMEINGKSIMDIMMLSAVYGTLLTITVDGDDEAETLDDLTKLITDNFGEVI